MHPSSTRGSTTAITNTPTPTHDHLADAGPAAQATPQPQSNPRNTVLLFRSDLRLHDNPALCHAVQHATSCIPVYCFDTRHLRTTQLGASIVSRLTARFLIDAICDLRTSLQSNGTDLVVRVGPPEQIIPDLCEQHNCKSVFLHKEVTREEFEVEERLEEALTVKGIQMQTFWGNTLYDQQDLPFDISSMPDIYGDFGEQVENITIRAPLPVPPSIPPLPEHVTPGEMPTLVALGFEETPVNAPESPNSLRSLTGGETEAMRRLMSHVDQLSRSRTANPTIESIIQLEQGFATRMSPYTSIGCISPRRIFCELKKIATSPDALLKTFTYSELLWRDFFRFLTAKFVRMKIFELRN